MLKRRNLLILSLLCGLLLFAFPSIASAESNESLDKPQTEAIYPAEAEIEAMNDTEIQALITEFEEAYPNEGEMPEEAFLALSIARGQDATFEQEAEADRKATIVTGAVVVVVLYSAGVLYYFERKKRAA